MVPISRPCSSKAKTRPSSSLFFAGHEERVGRDSGGQVDLAAQLGHFADLVVPAQAPDGQLVDVDVAQFLRFQVERLEGEGGARVRRGGAGLDEHFLWTP